MAKETVIIRDEGLRKMVLLTIGALDLAKPWKVTIERETNRRSLSQNRLMWFWVASVVKHVMAHTGHDSEEIHEFFKQKFLQPRMVEVGNDVRAYYSTRNLTTQEMSLYMDSIYAFCTTELGLFLPVPEDLGRAA